MKNISETLIIDVEVTEETRKAINEMVKRVIERGIRENKGRVPENIEEKIREEINRRKENDESKTWQNPIPQWMYR